MDFLLKAHFSVCPLFFEPDYKTKLSTIVTKKCYHSNVVLYHFHFILVGYGDSSQRLIQNEYTRPSQPETYRKSLPELKTSSSKSSRLYSEVTDYQGK